MSGKSKSDQPRTAPIFRPPATPAPVAGTDGIISSSPAFATPVHPVRAQHIAAPAPKPSILPILLPVATLRPVAFRTFTKKHGLTLASSALAVLATFVGRHCGAEWREQGLAELLLEEVARSWKRAGGGVIVAADTPGRELEAILKSLVGNMSAGRVVRGLGRQGSGAIGDPFDSNVGIRRGRVDELGKEDSQSSLGLSSLEVDEDEDEENSDPRRWLKAIDAYDQPRLAYDVKKKHFDRYEMQRFFTGLYEPDDLIQRQYQTDTPPSAITQDSGLPQSL